MKKPKRYIPNYITNVDLSLEEILNFFNNCDYTQDVVDVIIKITADALGINVMVYQENQGITELLEVPGCQFGKTVFVKYIFILHTFSYLYSSYPSFLYRSSNILQSTFSHLLSCMEFFAMRSSTQKERLLARYGNPSGNEFFITRQSYQNKVVYFNRKDHVNETPSQFDANL